MHLIGVLESGVIVPPVVASVSGHPGAHVRIDSVAIGGGKPLTGERNELTLVVGQATIEASELDGCVLKLDGCVLTAR
jgi:hypothetical protein